MIFEYLPTNLTQDIESLCEVCRILPISKVLIPSNPVAKPYPESLAITETLRSAIWQEKTLRHINFIPTIKTSIHTMESLQSTFLSLQYLNISNVAIISGDTSKKDTLTTYHALEILKHMQSKSYFLQQLNIFCALEATISAQNSYGFCKKMQYGVRNFITQPFYIVNQDKYNLQEIPTVPYNVPHFLSNKKIQSFVEFLHFYKHVAQLYSHNIALFPLRNNVKIYCGFLPLFQTKHAHTLNSKKLGIIIPNSYINDINSNALCINISLFNSLKKYNLSISYLQFKDFKIFLNSLKYSHISRI